MIKCFLRITIIATAMILSQQSFAQSTAWRHVSLDKIYKPKSTYFNNEDAKPIEFYGSENDQIIIPVKINGEQLWALVDTGTPSTTVSIRWAKSRKLSFRKEMSATGFAGSQYRQWITPILSIDIGPFHQIGGGVIVSNVPEIFNSPDGKAVEVILGMDFISNFSFVADFDKKLFSIMPSGSPAPSGHALNIESDNFYTKAVLDITLNGRTVKSLVDTGSDGSISIYKGAIDKLPTNSLITDMARATFSGVVVSDYTIIDGVNLDRFNINRPVSVELQNSRDGWGGDGSIGLEILDDYNIFLDVKRGIMVLSERTSSPKPLHKTNMGIQGNITEGAWIVAHVMRNSPAALVGIKDGDRICSVDGKTFNILTQIPRGPDGSIMHIILCDGRKMELLRKTFY